MKSIIHKCTVVSIVALGKVSSLWASAMEFANSGEFCNDALIYPGKAIHQTTD